MRKKNRQSRVGLGFLDPENMADKVVSWSLLFSLINGCWFAASPFFVFSFFLLPSL
jgi:hypothetical protein